MADVTSFDETGAALIELEERFWTGDADFYRDALTSDFLMMFPGLGTMDREATIAGVAGGQRWQAVRIREPRVTRLGDDAAILSYTAHARRTGDDSAYAALVSSAYVQRDGVWDLAFHHQTPVDDAA